MAYNSNSSCYFNCSQAPDHLSPYPDISGVGVLIGYTATAGIVVLILVFHYYLAHDPTKDPFRKENVSGSRNPRPNPIDVVYLSLPSKVLAWLRPRRNLPKAKTYPRLEAVFIKCVQSMSDLQILTGISILISGYVQLRCGLSAYHWQIIVLLAWFSSITHLSCLTFLRNHLYNRPVERAWRLVAMGLMLLMLLVAMIPTGGYNWTDVYYRGDGFPTPAPSDYAICYLRPAGNDDELTFSTMVVSVVLLVMGFIYRVIRLHKALSVSVVGRARAVCSEKARYFLCRVYTRMGMETSGLTFKRMFLYRPLLTLFFTARALLDLWSSMFIEILWMVASFSWGIIRLLQTLQIDDRGFSDWSFGQVVPIVLLAAPLLAIFESYFKAQEPTNTLSTALVQFHTAYSQSDHSNVSSNTPLQARDHPDYEFYQNSSWAHSSIYLMAAYAIGLTAELLTVSGLANMKLVELLIPTPIVPAYLPIYTALTIWMFTMISMLLEDIDRAQRNALRSFMGITRKNFVRWCKMTLFCISLTGAFMGYIVGDLTSVSFFCANAAMYCVLAIMVHVTTVRHGNVFL